MGKTYHLAVALEFSFSAQLNVAVAPSGNIMFRIFSTKTGKPPSDSDLAETRQQAIGIKQLLFIFKIFHLH